VVLLIMAILLAIAIPTFLGVKGGASDRSAQSNLDTAVKEAIGVYGNTQSFATGFQAAGPELTWNNDAGGSDFPATLGSGTNLVHAGGSTVSYWVGDAASSGDNLALVLAAYSKSSGTCFYVTQLEATPANAEIGGTDTASFTSTSGHVLRPAAERHRLPGQPRYRPVQLGEELGCGAEQRGDHHHNDDHCAVRVPDLGDHRTRPHFDRPVHVLACGVRCSGRYLAGRGCELRSFVELLHLRSCGASVLGLRSRLLRHLDLMS